MACLCSTRQQQSFGTALAWTEEHRPGAQSRWREGTLLELFRRWARCKNHAVGTPDGVETAQATGLEPDEGVWDVELLWIVNVFHGSASVGGPSIGVRMPRTLLPASRSSLLCQQSLEQEEMECFEEFLTRDGCTLGGTSRSRSTVKLWDVKVVLHSAQKIIDQFLSQQRMQKSSGERNA